MRRGIVLGIGIAMLLPIVSFAQEDALRAQVRADLQADPRSASLSAAEFEELVASIASEAEVTGAAGEYLDTQSSFDYAPLFAAAESTQPSAIPAIVVAIVALVSILAAVIIHMMRNRGKRIEEPSDVAA